MSKLTNEDVRQVIAQNAARIEHLQKEVEYLHLVNKLLDTSLSNSQISENYAVE